MIVSGNIIIPDSDHYWITQARVPSTFLHEKIAGQQDAEGCVLVNLEINCSRISAIDAWHDEHVSPAPTVVLGGKHLWPALIDIHTHIDKSQVIFRLGPLDGSFGNARANIENDRIKYWTRDDIRERMEFSIRCAHVHGVAALRTHIDSYEGQANLSWSVFSELRSEWNSRVALQAAASVPIDIYTTEYGRKLANLVAATEGGLLGGVLRRSTESEYTYIDNIDDLLDAQFKLAKEYSLLIDLHVDETTLKSVCHLEHVAKAVIRHGLQGRVVCSHCCSLALQPDDKLESILTLCVEADISFVTLPTTNCYLQDRKLGRTPRLRGVAPLQEIRARKLQVAIASDNVRDALYPFGDYDMVENFRQSVCIYHLDQQLADSLAMLGPIPGSMMGVSPLGSLAVGGPANLIIFDASSIGEIVSRPQTDRVVVSNGTRIKDVLPRYPNCLHVGFNPPNTDGKSKHR